jgi:hypothetical protein
MSEKVVTGKIRGLLIALAALCSQLAIAPSAGAAIIQIKDEQSCAVVGLDASPASAQGGVHCADAGGSPFSLSLLLSGSISLVVGDSQTPSWNFVNDTGATVSDLRLWYSGALDSGSFVDMQLSGGQAQGWFDDCSAVNTTTNNCSGTEAPAPVSLPLEMHWRVHPGPGAGTGITADTRFNISTASFAHAGADAGWS